ncbi:MAG: right-handed parallel beta-helix repeat-containing protein [Roseburia sp.]|nr:right-handed parallel beta-helix repeat-containing protein [Anaeroplasma bactoclasticum]MCM1196203.1 right-handed parallel beta-helix repeat-containing protein [Roseburia sp.]MCM1556030.1 right-handed parallel beta-helix repeat-containing protein [Anaeroplasma bactoclasticum]
MKKIVLCGLSFLLVFSLVSCKKENEKNPTPPLSEKYKEFEDLFTGDWNTPGLYEKTGQEHTMPQTILETGMEINVLDYNAKPNDPTYDNFAAFKKALENASEGDTIYIPNGKYYFTGYQKASSEYDTHISLKSGVTLRGESKEGVVLVSNFNASKNENDSTTVIAAVNVKNVAIKNLTVTSNTEDSKLPDPDSSTLQNLVYTAPKYGITAASGGMISNPEDQARNILIENVLVEKFQRMGVRIASVQEVVVRSSTFQKATCLGGGGMGYGVNIQGLGNGFNCTDTYIDTCFNVVEDCHFVGPYLRHGALIQYSAHNNLIQNNTFADLLLDSIDMHGEDEYSNEICNNKIKNTRKGAGVGLGNTGATHDASGRNNFIHDNIISNGARGIDVLLGTPNTVIYKNTIENVSQGIKCSNANGTRILQNTIKNISGTGISVAYSYVYGNATAGLPTNYQIKNNTFDSCKQAIYIDSKGDNFVVLDNTYINIAKDAQFVDDSSSFLLPEESNLMEPVLGTMVLPKENMFITMESPNKPAQYQKNMKFKTSNLEPNFNRMIYALFDKTEMPKSYDSVYLSFTAKAQVGTPTIDIFLNTTYTDWTTDSICWNNSLLHHETLALIKNTEEHPVTEFAQFTFPIAIYDFNTYYIDVTESFSKIDADLFTLVLTNENIDESYMEIYSKEQSANDYAQAFRLIFVNPVY